MIEFDDEDELDVGAMLEVRRDIARQLARLHPSETTVRAELEADDKTLSLAIEDAKADLEYVAHFSEALADNPLAAELAHMFLEESQSRTDEGVMDFFRELATRWEDGTAERDAEREPDIAFEI